MVTIVRREMGLDHREFFRSLPKAMGTLAYTIDHTDVLIRDGERTLRIHLHPSGERRIALLRLPVTLIEFAFDGYTDTEITAFMQGFERHYQRGGG